MKIKIGKDQLTAGARPINGALSARTTLPILHSFLLEASDKGGVRVTSTDLSIFIQNTFKASVDAAGSCTVPADKFFKMLASFGGGDVELALSDKNKLRMKCGKSLFILTGTSKEEFPEVPVFDKTKTFEMSVEDALYMIDKTLFAASQDEVRPILSGVLWVTKKGGLEMAATDGMRMATVFKKGIAVGKEFSAIVPKKVLESLLAVLKESNAESVVRVGVTEDKVVFGVGGTIMTSKTIVGAYPDYESAIPKKSDMVLEVDTEALLAIIDRATLCLDNGRGWSVLELTENALRITVATQNAEFDESLEVAYKGADLKIGLQPKYLSEALKHADAEKVRLGMTAPMKPILIEPRKTDIRFIVMPMNLGK